MKKETQIPHWVTWQRKYSRWQQYRESRFVGYGPVTHICTQVKVKRGIDGLRLSVTLKVTVKSNGIGVRTEHVLCI